MSPSVIVWVSFAFASVWFLVIEACTPALPEEGPITVTVAASLRDH